MPSSVVRRGPWKLIETFDPEGVELYNLADDLGETNNLAAAKPDLAGELRRELDAWRKEVGAEMMRPNPDYDPAARACPRRQRKKAKQGMPRTDNLSSSSLALLSPAAVRCRRPTRRQPPASPTCSSSPSTICARRSAATAIHWPSRRTSTASRAARGSSTAPTRHQAVCGPARTAILTGRLPDNTRVWHNRNLFRNTLPDAVTLPQLFKNNGYQALSFGKVFSGD